MTRLLILIGCAWCALLVHEVGHLVAGRIVRFRFGFLAVGPIWVAREGARVRIRWNRLLATWGGAALSYPTDTRSLTGRMAFYSAGGPLASFALCVIAFSFYRLASPSGFALGLAITSAAVLLATAQPFGTGIGVPSDGRRVVRFLTHWPGADAETSVVALEGAAIAGVRPREWDAALIRTIEGIRYPAALALAAATLLLRHRLDRKQLSKASDAADSLLAVYDLAPRFSRGDPAAEIAFYLSFFRREIPGAEKFLKDARSPLTERHRRLRAEAAVLLRSGNVAGATSAIAKAEAALEHPRIEVTDLDRDLVAAVRRDLVGQDPLNPTGVSLQMLG